MTVFLGNIMPHEFKRYFDFELNDEHLEFFRKTHQCRADLVPENLGARQWHLFDLPRVLICGSKAFADELVAILRQYKIKGRIEVRWYKD